jgi:hypothetical protein
MRTYTLRVNGQFRAFIKAKGFADAMRQASSHYKPGDDVLLTERDTRHDEEE